MRECRRRSRLALALPDDAALLKAMGRGELEARVREYARAEAVAPADVQADIVSIDDVRQHYSDQAKAARQAQREERAPSSEELTRIMEADRERLQVADAARREWEESGAFPFRGADVLSTTSIYTNPAPPLAREAAGRIGSSSSRGREFDA
jgi:hypothetical protein